LTDHGVLYGAVEFYKEAKKAGVKPIIGSEVYVAREKMTDKRPNIDDKRFQQKYTGNESYLIKNGKIDKPVISPIIEITTPALFSSIDAVANNLKLFAGTCGKGEPMQGIPVTMGGPSIRLRGIKLG